MRLLLCFLWACCLLSSAQAQDSCVDDKLVNHCRIWFGATASQYKEVEWGPRNQIEYFEKRLGRKIDIAHTYHGVGKDTLKDDDYYFINRADTILMTNWKPAARWSDADGSNEAINDTIDQMARSIKRPSSSWVICRPSVSTQNARLRARSVTVYSTWLSRRMLNGG